ncbi:MAG: hypothetical protein KYX69_22895, partial [Sphingomonas sp.]|uniref:hypothetical protein n=1 Tax=Sphingomonas sp. TaxID=28214 RepID=UPI002630DFAE
SGRSRSNWASLNQNSLKSTLLLAQRMNHIPAAKGIPFMGPDPKTGARLVESMRGRWIMHVSSIGQPIPFNRSGSS